MLKVSTSLADLLIHSYTNSIVTKQSVRPQLFAEIHMRKHPIACIVRAISDGTLACSWQLNVRDTLLTEAEVTAPRRSAVGAASRPLQLQLHKIALCQAFHTVAIVLLRQICPRKKCFSCVLWWGARLFAAALTLSYGRVMCWHLVTYAPTSSVNFSDATLHLVSQALARYMSHTPMSLTEDTLHSAGCTCRASSGSTYLS